VTKWATGNIGTRQLDDDQSAGGLHSRYATAAQVYGANLRCYKADAMGPITLFDKSFLQGLSVDEAVWFDHFFYPVIAPLFYIETMADLQKIAKGGRTAEQVVATIAAKTPQMSGGPVYFHQHLAQGALLGNSVPMDGRIPIAYGRTVSHNGKKSTYIDQPPEYVAFQRWQQGRFEHVEYRYAKAWRDYLAQIDLKPLRGAIQANGGVRCRDLGEAKARAAAVVNTLHKSSGRFNTALDILGIEGRAREIAKDRWKHYGRPSFMRFAPYATYVLTVEVFFYIAVASDLIASTRPSHRIDIGYLHYLPFCHIFVSTDKLHRSCAPQFLRENQRFVWGQDLKTDLAAINAHYTALDESERARGIYRFANRLPEINLPTIRPLFEQFTPSLLRPPEHTSLPPDLHSRHIAELEGIRTAPSISDPQPLEDLDQLVIERRLDRQRGAWTVVPPEIADGD
jgi:hypothetical protein